MPRRADNDRVSLDFPPARFAVCLLVFLCVPACSPESSSETPCRTDDDCASLAPKHACRHFVCQEPVCPAGSVYVGSGPFERGCNADETDCDKNAQPRHTVVIDHGFCASVTELQVGQYRQCIAQGGCPASHDLRCSADLATWTDVPAAQETMPMTCLLWSEALAACRFLGGRLPTEAEWEKLARGRDARLYPWGNVQPLGCGTALNYDGGGNCPDRPWPATPENRKGAQLSSPFSAVDLAGNVWEWVTDNYSETAYQDCASGCVDPIGPITGFLRCRRGGSYKSSRFQELTTFFRDFHTPEVARSDNQGARCIFPQ